jgi:hypothetical protein
MLSAIVTSSLFLNSTVDYVQNIIIFFSIFSTILAGFQTLVRPSEQAEIHRSKAVKYGVLRREIELFLSSDKSEDKKEEFLEKLKSKWDNIADNSPVTPRSLRIKASKVLSNDLIENRELRNIKNSSK